MRICPHVIAAISSLMLAAALGCATPGAPLPPSLELPTPVTDLTAARKGNRVVLSWTPSRRTTDRQNIRHFGVTRVCRTVDSMSMVQCGDAIREIPSDQLPKPTNQQPDPRLVVEDNLPTSLLSRQGFATYAVEMVNQRGRSAGLSNQVRIPLAPTLPPPQQLSSMVTAEGVAVAWETEAAPPTSPELRFHYRLLRRPAGTSNFTLVEDVPIDSGARAIPDKSFEWEQTYEYKLTPVTDVLENGQEIAEVEGEDSGVIKVTVHDTFPPTQTSGLQAVFSGAGQEPFIDLTWAPNTESDLAGYDVFRHEQGSAPTKINDELVKAPSFRDDNVALGREYFYAVRAVDLRGNTGPMSVETSERVPAAQ